MAFFAETNKNPKIHLEPQRTPNNQNNLEKRKRKAIFKKITLAFAPGLTREICPHQEQLRSHINAKIGNVKNKKDKNRAPVAKNLP